MCLCHRTMCVIAHVLLTPQLLHPTALAVFLKQNGAFLGAWRRERDQELCQANPLAAPVNLNLQLVCVSSCDLTLYPYCFLSKFTPMHFTYTHTCTNIQPDHNTDTSWLHSRCASDLICQQVCMEKKRKIPTTQCCVMAF